MRLPLSSLRLLRLLAVLFPLTPLVAALLASPAEPLSLGAAAGAALFTGTLCAMPALLRFPGWLALVWHLLSNTVAAVVLFAMLVTGGFPNLATCLAALKTDAGEAAQVLSAAGRFVALVGAAWLAQLPGCVSFAWRAPRTAISTSRLRILALAPLTLPMLLAPVAQTYPARLAGLVSQVSQYLQAADRVNLADAYRVTVRTAPAATALPELVVFVVGESSQAEYWQLLGYSQPSSPAMARRDAAGELVVFRRHMSTAAATRFAVPALLSPFEHVMAPATGHRPSLVTLMARAGYDTGWLSVQGPLPAASEAQEALFTSDAEVLGMPGEYDDRLLAQSARWLGRHTSRPGFLVLHTAGSHIPYEARYPAGMARWHDFEGMDFPKSQTVGNYLNTILYTDTVLDQLMTQLARERRPVLLVYVSDHGEGSMKRLSRDHAPLEGLLHVPFFLWGNTAWREAHGGQWNALARTAQTNPVTSHLNIVPTLTSLQGIDYEGKPKNRDLLSASFQPWVRTPALRVQTMERIEVTPVP
jgi:glucan phosphoethanolaminetransferase (alkaline phosphatase superfamily)